MNSKLDAALNNVQTNYAELVTVANDMIQGITGSIDELVAAISDNANNMSIELLRDSILKLQLKAYELSEIKEKAAMKAELSAALQKEAFAIKFNSLDGAAATKEKLATAETSSELVSNVLFNLVSNLLKTKLDQLHRLVDAMKSILMSRMQETKFMQLSTTNDMPGITNGRVTLNEDMKGTF